MVINDQQQIGVILAEGRSSILGSSQSVPTGLLPICGKPILAHRIDEFRDLGLQRIIVVTDERKAVEDARIELNAFSLNLEICGPGDLVVGEGTRVFLASAEFFSEPVFKLFEGTSPELIVQCRSGRPIAASVTDMSVADGIAALRGHSSGIECLQSTMSCVELDSIDAFISTNIDVLRGDFVVPRISGLKVAPHVHLEWVMSAKPANIKGAVHIGDGAVLHPTSRVEDCVIGRKAVILPRAKLERCVVMPGAMVPENASLSDAVVTKTLTVFNDPNKTRRELERYALERAVR